MLTSLVLQGSAIILFFMLTYKNSPIYNTENDASLFLINYNNLEVVGVLKQPKREEDEPGLSVGQWIYHLSEVTGVF